MNILRILAVLVKIAIFAGLIFMGADVMNNPSAERFEAGAMITALGILFILFSPLPSKRT